jgi:hypothetical protein
LQAIRPANQSSTERPARRATTPFTTSRSAPTTAADAHVIAGSRLLIENGIGHDPWAARLVAADGFGAHWDAVRPNGAQAG